MNIPDIASRTDLIIWPFDFALSTFVEVETSQLEPLIPSQLKLMEVVPGVSLLSITAFHFREGCLDGLPAFEELICSVIVAPDLRRGVPDFAMHVLSLASTSQEHLDHSRSYYRLPIYGLLTEAEIKPETGEVRFGDGEGDIVTMRRSHPEPVFRDEERYYQAFVEADSQLFVSDMLIKAPLFEHQRSDAACELSDHPFFRGLKLANTDAIPYLQMIGEPGKTGRQYYPEPEIFT